MSHMMYNQELIIQRIFGKAPAEKIARPARNDSKKPTTSPTEKKSDVKSGFFSACLYAGFVIQDLSCKAPRELPKNDLLNGVFNSDTFKCASAEVICNPLLFGFEGTCQEATSRAQIKKCFSDVKPVCIPNSITATRNCKEKTSNNKYLENALKIINFSPDLLRDLVREVSVLCEPKNNGSNLMISKRKNSDRIRKDIEATCAVANPKITSVLKNYEALSVRKPATNGADSFQKTKK